MWWAMQLLYTVLCYLYLQAQGLVAYICGPTHLN